MPPDKLASVELALYAPSPDLFAHGVVDKPMQTDLKNTHNGKIYAYYTLALQ